MAKLNINKPAWSLFAVERVIVELAIHTSRHKLPTQHGISRDLLLIAIRAHHRVSSRSGGLSIIRVKSPQLLSPCHGVAGRGWSVGNARAKERGEGVRVGGESGIA